MTTYVLDAETNLAHNKIWMVVVYNPETGEHHDCRTAAALQRVIKDATLIIWQGGFDFDEHVIARVWHIVWPDCEYHDTLVMSRLWCPRLEGGHSLGAWGKRLGDLKGDFTDFDHPATEMQWSDADGKDEANYPTETREEWLTRMLKYCKQDVELTWKLYNHLLTLLKKSHCTKTAFRIEHKVAAMVARQVQNGMYFDLDGASALFNKLTTKEESILEEMQELFPPLIWERYSDKQKDKEGNWKQLKDGFEEFNPNSRPQIAQRLISVGVKFTETTETGQWKIDEDVLEAIDHPAAMKIHEYMMVGKRLSQLNQWFEYYNEDTHRIHGKVNSNGTATSRMAQFKPNMAQVPGNKKPYGSECRSLWRAAPGFVLLGFDAAGLELRCFANRVGDADYIDTVVNGDAHQYHADLLGCDRDTAKIFLYAFIYGAGNAKLGKILSGSMRHGKLMRERFMEFIPGLVELTAACKEMHSKYGHIRGMDGRLIRTKSGHSALNYQLQSDGAIVMKQALCNLDYDLHIWSCADEPKLVVQAHDEWQFECLAGDAEHLGRLAVGAIERVQADFNTLVPFTGTYLIGPSWTDTH